MRDLSEICVELIGKIYVHAGTMNHETYIFAYK